MAVRSKSYWKQRFQQLEEAQNRKGLECYADIERQYREAQRTIESLIAKWYQRFADNNEISMAEARRLLNSKELAEFKWDVRDYIKYGEENAISGQWMKQLENASARYHVSRLEALKLQTQQSIEALYGNQLDNIDTAMRDIYTSGYYHTAYEIQKGVGIGWDFATLDERTISKVINKPWAADGKNFSSRIWSNKEKLVNELNTTLVQNIMLGQDPQKAIDVIAKKLNTSKYNAGRLVMTEEAYFSSVATKDCYEELDVEEYEILATIDSHTSDICRSLDGKVYKMSEYEAGVTAPPFHPWCRSTTIPHFDDDFGSVGERAARGEDGKTYTVPGDMTYNEWKEKYVDGGGESGLAAGGSGNGNGNEGVTEHKNPVTLGEVDYTDENAVLSTLEKYEKEIADSNIENAVVITKSGEVIQCFGNLNGVYPDADLGDKLKGAYVTHNHPVGSDNEYSFSSQDIRLFMENDLKELRCVDEKYVYKLTRNADDIDENVSILDIDEFSGRHEHVIGIARSLKIGYRRYKHE